MLLKQMLEDPKTSSKLVVYDPFKPLDRDSLLKEVVGVANARVEGPRNILFGVNPSAINGNTIVGLSDDAVGDLKRAYRLVASVVEPGLELAFIFDRINGKLVGALEVDGCDYGPYFLAHDLTDELQRGACWIREERELLAVERHELLNGHASVPEEAAPVVLPDSVSLTIGFNDDPDCNFLEAIVPESSDPPFSEAGDGALNSLSLTQTLKRQVNTTTARILSFGRQGESANDDINDTQGVSMQIADAARKHYFMEDRALKLALCVRNDSGFDVEDVTVEISLPRLAGLEVASRIYPNPFDASSGAAARKLGYPSVARKEGAIIVKACLPTLPKAQSQPLFSTALRIAVGPESLGRKIAMQYVLRRADGKRVGDGRLKIRLGPRPDSQSKRESETTHYQSLDEERS